MTTRTRWLLGLVLLASASLAVALVAASLLGAREPGKGQGRSGFRLQLPASSRTFRNAAPSLGTRPRP